ncbi:hypothetical protein M569_01440 [Genlisea aurea]|uniref:FAS1 domain-containing protein n=1 Tax=Genlisea aurea TaxID=192259 RepID=S8D0K1_9LAMI|nr:hypothetical protein M569_01440 [Genlisea aurea]
MAAVGCFLVLLLFPVAGAAVETPTQENVVEEIVIGGTFDMAGWLNLLASSNNNNNATATVFVPGMDAISHFSGGGGVSFDPLLIPYHVVTHRFAFSDLRKLPVRTRLPTLLPGRFIVVTDNSASHFTIDDTKTITQPDVFLTDALAVHGIDNVLEYSNYGDEEDDGAARNPPLRPANNQPPESPPPPVSTITPSISPRHSSRMFQSLLLDLSRLFLFLM